MLLIYDVWFYIILRRTVLHCVVLLGGVSCQSEESLNVDQKEEFDIEPFWFAVTKDQAQKSLGDFVDNRLNLFGPYEDAMAQDEKFLFHSVLSMYLNIGLLDPKDVIQKVFLSIILIDST